MLRSLLRWRILMSSSMRATVEAVEDLPNAEFIKTFRLGKAEVRALTIKLTPLLPRQENSKYAKKLQRIIQ